MGFKTLGIQQDLVEQLNLLNISEPTPIQKSVIPKILSHQNIVASSQTGSGKTLAYLLPLLQGIKNNLHQEKVEVLVLVPTRELAQQIGAVCSTLCGKLELNTSIIYGGVPYEQQIKSLAKNPSIVIATPGRLMDLLEQQAIELSDVNYFVLDEVDQMLDLGFKDAILQLAKLRQKNAQTCCFSATVKKDIKELINNFISNIEFITIENQKIAVERIEQSAYYVERSMMDHLLLHLLRKEKSEHAIVFTRSRSMADRITKLLREHHFSAEAFHSDRTQAAREYILGRFKSGETSLLIATDVMARGIDVDHITHIFNYGLPQNTELYIHRIGRTARAGRNGKAISLCEPTEKALLGEIQKLMKQSIPILLSHPFMTVAVTKILSDLTASGKKKK